MSPTSSPSTQPAQQVASTPRDASKNPPSGTAESNASLLKSSGSKNTPNQDKKGRAAARKLKTYSGKKRLSSGKSRRIMDGEDDEEVVQTPTARVATSPELGDEPSDAQLAPPAAEEEVESSMPSASQQSEPRARVSRNRALLESLRGSQTKTRKTQARRSRDAAEAGEEQAEQGARVMNGLNNRGEKTKDVEEAQEQEEGDEEFQVPSDLEHVEAEPVATKKAKKSKSSSKRKSDKSVTDDTTAKEEKTSQDKEKRKRKRDSTDRVSPEATTKKQKKSKVDTAQSAEAVNPPSLSTGAGPTAAALNYPAAGNFIPQEVELIEAAYEEARIEYNFTKEEMIRKVQTSAKEIQALLIQITDEVLPNRNRKAVQRFFRRHFNDAERGKWTQEQDDMLVAAHEETPGRWVAISHRVGRLPEDCRDRWRNFASLRGSRHTDVWTRDEELALAKAVAESIAGATERLGRALTTEEEDQYISWPVIIKKMGGRRNRLQCTNKWKKIRRRNAKAEVERNNQPIVSADDDKMEKTAAKKRFKQMEMGDIYQMMKEIEYGNHIGRIDDFGVFWSVVTKMHPTSPYTTQDRKTAYKKLRPMVEDTGDFPTNVTNIIQFVEAEFASTLHLRFLQEKPVKRGKGAGRGGGQRQAKDYRSEAKVLESDGEEDPNAQLADLSEDVDMTGEEVEAGAEQGEEEEGAENGAEDDEALGSPHVSESEADGEDKDR